MGLPLKNQKPPKSSVYKLATTTALALLSFSGVIACYWLLAKRGYVVLMFANSSQNNLNAVGY
jgi:hypothetical protein